MCVIFKAVVTSFCFYFINIYDFYMIFFGNFNLILLIVLIVISRIVKSSKYKLLFVQRWTLSILRITNRVFTRDLNIKKLKPKSYVEDKVVRKRCLLIFQFNKSSKKIKLKATIIYWCKGTNSKQTETGCVDMLGVINLTQTTICQSETNFKTQMHQLDNVNL